jgi:VWFA-related protein
MGIARAKIAEILNYPVWLYEMMAGPEPNSVEWIENFSASSTMIPAGSEMFDIELALEFPGRNQNRTAVAGVVRAPLATPEEDIDGVVPIHQYLLTGEVVRDGKLFEQFHYRFESPPGKEVEGTPLIFQRYLRPGEIDLHLKVEDLMSRRFARLTRTVTIPSPDELDSLREPPDSELFRILAEARQASERGQSTIRLVPPPEGSVHIGLMRFSAVVTGDVQKVAFFLDGRQVMAKNRPPYSLELDLGDAAAFHQLRVEGYDAAGAVIASDERRVNRGGQRFRVRLVEPVRDQHYTASLAAVAQVEIPDGESLERLELFLGEQRVATLFQEPFEQAIVLPDDSLTYVRAVGYLADGNTAEDTVFINAPEYFEHLDVRFVELYAGVFRNGRPILDLTQEDFEIFEDEQPQEIRRFEAVKDLPIHTALLIDTSASMGGKLESVAAAARTFIDQTINPRDRATLMSFSNRVEVPVRFTNQTARLASGLASLRPSGGTALYDSLIFALHYFDGIKGPKALLLLSDGEDEASRFDLDHVMATARRAGVMIYVIGLREVAEKWETRQALEQVAKETGGRSFFLTGLEELPGVYQTIEEELRSQYLLVYQSDSTRGKDEFRTVKVTVDRGRTEVRTLSGYYP